MYQSERQSEKYKGNEMKGCLFFSFISLFVPILLIFQTGEVVKIYSHGKNDTQIVVLMGNGPVSWITYDCGATFKAITKDHLK